MSGVKWDLESLGIDGLCFNLTLELLLHAVVRSSRSSTTVYDRVTKLEGRNKERDKRYLLFLKMCRDKYDRSVNPERSITSQQ